MDQTRRLINQLATLLDDADFRLELKTFRRAYQRLKIRLRNNQLMGHVKLLARTTRQLEEKFPGTLLKTYERQVARGDKKQKKSVQSLQLHVQQLIEFLDKSLGVALFVHAYTQPYFRVGHLSHHFIVLRNCIARFRICIKALLVYSCDLYLEISNLKLIQSVLSKDQLDSILTKHECKPRNLIHTEDAALRAKEEHPKDAVGQLVDRKTMQIQIGSVAKKAKLN